MGVSVLTTNNINHCYQKQSLNDPRKKHNYTNTCNDNLRIIVEKKIKFVICFRAHYRGGDKITIVFVNYRLLNDLALTDTRAYARLDVNKAEKKSLVQMLIFTSIFFGMMA